MEYIEKELSEEEKEEIYRLVCIADKEFIPSLSSRIPCQLDFSISLEKENPDEYFKGLIKQKFILVKDNNQVIGFMSYIPDKKLDEFSGIYVSTIIIDPKYRGQGIANKLYDIIISKNEPIFVRTWSTNKSHLKVLENKEFELVKTIPNDRGENIDTVYFRKN